MRGRDGASKSTSFSSFDPQLAESRTTLSCVKRDLETFYLFPFCTFYPLLPLETSAKTFSFLIKLEIQILVVLTCLHYCVSFLWILHVFLPMQLDCFENENLEFIKGNIFWVILHCLKLWKIQFFAYIIVGWISNIEFFWFYKTVRFQVFNRFPKIFVKCDLGSL